MNNEELKKKIVEVLTPVIKAGNISCNEENACKKCWFPCEIERTAERLADALIAAGIGDVKEAEHRAEVAERALFLSAKEIEYLNGNFDSSAEFFAKEKVIPFFIRQAEKELAEEGKDE